MTVLWREIGTFYWLIFYQAMSGLSLDAVFRAFSEENFIFDALKEVLDLWKRRRVRALLDIVMPRPN